MKANITRASDSVYENKVTIIEINTLEDLINLIKKEGSIIIYEIEKNNELNITIYDDYVE